MGHARQMCTCEAESVVTRSFRCLTAQEIEAYDLVPSWVAQRARFRRVRILPPGAVGLTSGRFVFLLRDEPADGTSVIIAHELVHVRQFAELGRLRFGLRYLVAYVANLLRYRSHHRAYLAIPAEREAYGLAESWSGARAV